MCQRMSQLLTQQLRKEGASALILTLVKQPRMEANRAGARREKGVKQVKNSCSHSQNSALVITMTFHSGYHHQGLVFHVYLSNYDLILFLLLFTTNVKLHFFSEESGSKQIFTFCVKSPHLPHTDLFRFGFEQ